MHGQGQMEVVLLLEYWVSISSLVKTPFELVLAGQAKTG